MRGYRGLSSYHSFGCARVDQRFACSTSRHTYFSLRAPAIPRPFWYKFHKFHGRFPESVDLMVLSGVKLIPPSGILGQLVTSGFRQRLRKRYHNANNQNETNSENNLETEDTVNITRFLSRVRNRNHMAWNQVPQVLN